jgi:hypothetical protein
LITKSENYRGFSISWLEPPTTSAKWTANVTSESPQLYGLTGLNGAQIIDGRTRDDMLDNARGYINNLLDRRGAG